MLFSRVSTFVSLAAAVCFFVSTKGHTDLPNSNQFLFYDSSFSPGDWRSTNHDINNTRNNPWESIISPSNVTTLLEKWSAQAATTEAVITAPLVLNNVVYYGDSNNVVQARNVSDGSLIWQQTLDAPIESGMVVTSGSVYVATSNLSLYSLNVQTGQVLWQQVVDPAARASGQASCLAGLVLVDDIIIAPVSNSQQADSFPVPLCHGSLNAFNTTDGSFLWRYIPSPAPGGAGIGFWSTPAVDIKIGLLFVGTSNASSPPAGNLSDSLLAIDYVTGNLKWANQFTQNDLYGNLYPNGPDTDVGASPNLFSIVDSQGKKIDVVGVCDKTGNYRALNRKTGSIIWTQQITSTPCRYGDPAAAYDGNNIYVIANSDPLGLITGPVAIKGGNGDLASQAELIGAIKLEVQSVIKALNPINGNILWQATIPASATGGGLTVANGVIYQADFNGILRAFDGATGILLNLIQIPPSNTQFGPMSVPIQSGITVSNGQIFFGYGYTSALPGGIACYALPNN